MNQSELEATTCNRAKRGKTRASKSRWLWVLLLIGQESGARVLTNQRAVKQNQSKHNITFDAQFKTALTHSTNHLSSSLLFLLRPCLCFPLFLVLGCRLWHFLPFFLLRVFSRFIFMLTREIIAGNHSLFYDFIIWTVSSEFCNRWVR